MEKPVLYYVYDPMCSWCWGYRPTWQSLQEKLKPVVEIQYRLGGLAPDSDAPMPVEMQHFLQQTWHKISRQLGTEFNFDFWSLCRPRRSTYPACRAALIAREYGKEQAMYLGIQQAYYLQAKNPSDDDTLIEIAAGIGLDKAQFKAALDSREVRQKLLEEIAATRALPVQGFPSLVLAAADRQMPVTLDYHHWQTSYDNILEHLSSFSNS
ncbi:DsbA family protein [Thalassomonas viridans]|uniref:DsbA family protein n=1 Tax=Thalassomonas viridans TaxID=137584 RepID=A0AAF0CEV8_9GAMM|nr:DsbA family protein [Thalassomonas viridans]WDE08892.1 DsbA family protein [Thalassomonas viridans]WDE08939.1 DsbA family protein [Thalassomonas viridans]